MKNLSRSPKASAFLASLQPKANSGNDTDDYNNASDNKNDKIKYNNYQYNSKDWPTSLERRVENRGS